MVLLGTVDVDDYMACLFRSAAAEHNVPAPLLLGIPLALTGLQITYFGATGDRERVGIFALRIFDVAAVSMPTAKAYCVREVLQVAAPLVAQAWAAEPEHYFNGATLFHVINYLEPLGFSFEDTDTSSSDLTRAVFDLSTDPFVQSPDSLPYPPPHPQYSPAEGPGTLYDWPPLDASVCAAGIPPPPPFGAWCEPYPPTSPETVESLMDAHMDRLAVLADGTY